MNEKRERPIKEDGENIPIEIEKEAVEIIETTKESPIKKQEEIGEVREEIRKQFKTEEKKELPSEEEIKEYQERHLPDYLKKPQGKVISAIAKLSGFLFTNRCEVSGKENLPEEGGFLVISNHFGGETNKILGLLKDYDTHMAAAKEVHWNRQGYRPWLLRHCGMLSIEESLSHLSDQEKEELVRRVPKKSHARMYQKVIEKERSGKVPLNKNFIREAVALLSRGDVVVMYPEGLIMYDGKNELRQGYGGIELMAKEYKKLTGKELSIVPVAVFNEQGKKIKVGEPIKIESPDIDSCIKEIAKLLPEEQRGYYK